MKFKLDENLPVSSAAILAGAGHDVDTAGQEGLSGATDAEVVAAATAAGRVLVSLDVGLGDIRAYPPLDAHSAWRASLHRAAITRMVSQNARRCAMATVCCRR